MKLLMCRPDHYLIEYEINPWMNVNRGVDQNVAVNQWQKLYLTLLSCGATIELIPPVRGLPDMVFTANSGLLYQNKIILPHFKYKERQGELSHFENWFRRAGFECWNQVNADTPFFEGEGDALKAGDRLFVGFGFRSDRLFYEQAPYLDQQKLIYCELIDPYFYHLDTCFCPLTEDLALWYPEAFGMESQQAMRDAIELLPVPEEEAKKFACNAVVLDKQVILPAQCPHTTALLEEHGFTVHGCEMNEYLKAGGACKCLTLYLENY